MRPVWSAAGAVAGADPSVSAPQSCAPHSGCPPSTGAEVGSGPRAAPTPKLDTSSAAAAASVPTCFGALRPSIACCCRARVPRARPEEAARVRTQHSSAGGASKIQDQNVQSHGATQAWHWEASRAWIHARTPRPACQLTANIWVRGLHRACFSWASSWKLPRCKQARTILGHLRRMNLRIDLGHDD